MNPARRERLGQVFTPAEVADLTLALALDGRDPRDLRVLDPACGDGVFLARALAAGVDRAHLAGVEIDRATAAAARQVGVEVRVGDFFAGPAPRADLVVGNPPYVRQETLGAAQKQKVRRRVMADHPGVDWPARADLAASFVARGLACLPEGGRLAFVLSTALLDAGYGEALRELLPGRARLVAVVAPAAGEPWFADAAIHAAIVVLERGSGEGEAVFARLRVPTGEVKIRRLADLERFARVRRVRAPSGSWAALLRAPDAWFDFAASAPLVPLHQVAELWRGTTSGANAFFYMTRAQAAERAIPERCLVPLYRSPKHAGAPRIDAAQLSACAFVCDEDAPAGGAATWIARHRHLAATPSLASRPRWWSLPVRPARVFLTKAYDSRFVQGFSPRPLVADQRVYALAARDGDDELLAAVLSGTPTAFAIESLGRASMGQGALELSVGDARALPIVDPRGVDRERVLAAFRTLSERPVLPIAEELERPDRRALDEALAPFDGSALVQAVKERTAAGRYRRRRG